MDTSENPWSYAAIRALFNAFHRVSWLTARCVLWSGTAIALQSRDFIHRIAPFRIRILTIENGNEGGNALVTVWLIVDEAAIDKLVSPRKWMEFFFWSEWKMINEIRLIADKEWDCFERNLWRKRQLWLDYAASRVKRNLSRDTQSCEANAAPNNATFQGQCTLSQWTGAKCQQKRQMNVRK